METVIKYARELGKALQQDELYIRYQMAQQASDDNEALKATINEFQAKREELMLEVQSGDKDSEKVKILNDAVQDLYETISTDSDFMAVSTAQQELNSLLTFVNQIISKSAMGQDPETIEFEDSCAGSCNSCSGCN